MKLAKKFKSLEFDKNENKAIFYFIKVCLVLFIILSIYIVSDILNGYNKPMVGYGLFDSFQNTIYNFSLAIDKLKIINTVLLLFSAYLVFKGITNNTKLSLIILYIIVVVFGIINYIVIDTRGTGISANDFFVIKTALSVISAIKIKFRFRLIIIPIIVYIDYLLFILISKCETKEKLKVIPRILYGIFGISIIVSFFVFPQIYFHEMKMWDINNAYHCYGAPQTLIASTLLKLRESQELENYDTNKAENILNGFSQEQEQNEAKLPNILIVLNESFTDTSFVYDYNKQKDELPFYHALLNSKENIVSGYTYSPVFGGGTSAPEYILLSQNYTSIINNDFFPYIALQPNQIKSNIIEQYKNLGYQTNAYHPYFANGYNRSKIWPNLGFTNTMFIEKMNLNDFKRQHIFDDETTYSYYYKTMNNKSKQKDFSFILTMQNHIPYANLSKEEKIEFTKDDEELNNYLNYIKLSDDGLKELIEYIDNYNEDIIMLFLGDHQPNIEFFNSQNVNSKFRNDEAYKYVVPFLIYANFDIEEEKNIITSMNYLQNILCEKANVPMNRYSKYLQELKKTIPTITTEYYLDYKGDKYFYGDVSSPYYSKIAEYKDIMKYNIFN